MNHRMSSPYPSGGSPRPTAHRKRSNSFPIVDALGCSTPEAELILAEGKAAVRTRQASVRRRGRRMRETMETFRPKYHLKYLEETPAVPENTSEDSLSAAAQGRHSRIPSNVTDTSTSTITASNSPPADEPRTTAINVRKPLGAYSANLAKFIQTQLNSIPSYKSSSISPISCPDLGFHARSPPQSPLKPSWRPSDAPQAIQIPPVRPPLQSAFSAWSSTDDDTDDDLSALPNADSLWKDSKAEGYTPSVLGYYENSNTTSLLFPSSPLDEESDPDTAKDLTFPNRSALLPDSYSPSQDADNDHPYPSSSILSTRPQISPSSAPSLSSTSTSSYFDYKRATITIRERIIAAVTPPQIPAKIIPAISPFEGGALANVHDVLVESQKRVLVDGMSFDMLREFTMPDEGLRRIPTPTC